MPAPASASVNSLHPSTLPPIPIILLKTPSTPTDAYSTYFSTPSSSTTSPSPPKFKPIFLPLLQHTLLALALTHLSALLTSPSFTQKYGGLILTSQRAVEALGSVLSSLENSPSSNSVSELEIPLYTVGPATSRALGVLRERYLPRCSIHGQETGNGANLAQYILTHYSRFPTPPPKRGTPKNDSGGEAPSQEESPVKTRQRLPLLFLVGEIRRDIIPVSLMSEALPTEEQTCVDELVVYETQLMGDFRERLSRTLCECGVEGGDGAERRRGNEKVEGEEDIQATDAVKPTKGKGPVCVVVFSPAVCGELVEVLRAGQGKGQEGEKKVFVATIGPTTRDVMVKEHGWVVDVCAEKPTPEGLGEGIERFMKERGIAMAGAI